MYFVGIGAQRAATTWLWNLLQSHPSVAASPIKELHYFSSKHVPTASVGYRGMAQNRLRTLLQGPLQSEPNPSRDLLVRSLSLWHTLRDDADYVEYFRQLQRSTGRDTFGEWTNTYALLPEEGFRNVRELFPEARFVLLLRNPADRLWSNFHVRVSAGHVPDTEEALRSFLKEPHTRARTAYEETIARVTRGAGRGALFVAFMEELVQQGSPQLAALLDFLELSPHTFAEQLLSARPELGNSRALPAALRADLVAAFADTYEAVHRVCGRLPESWQADVAQLEGAAIDAELGGDWA